MVDAASRLTEDNCTGVDVEPQNSCPIIISFKPTGANSYGGSIDIIVSFELELNVPVRGIGGQPTGAHRASQ